MMILCLLFPLCCSLQSTRTLMCACPGSVGCISKVDKGGMGQRSCLGPCSPVSSMKANEWLTARSRTSPPPLSILQHTPLIQSQLLGYSKPFDDKVAPTQRNSKQNYKE